MTQRCFECKTAFKENANRFYCCNRRQSICTTCANNKKCHDCGKHREKRVEVGKCSKRTCFKYYDVEDMFFDFKGNYFICPKCLAPEFRY